MFIILFFIWCSWRLKLMLGSALAGLCFLPIRRLSRWQSWVQPVIRARVVTRRGGRGDFSPHRQRQHLMVYHAPLSTKALISPLYHYHSMRTCTATQRKDLCELQNVFTYFISKWVWEVKTKLNPYKHVDNWTLTVQYLPGPAGGAGQHIS